jgi:hypothetical protein
MKRHGVDRSPLYRKILFGFTEHPITVWAGVILLRVYFEWINVRQELGEALASFAKRSNNQITSVDVMLGWFYGLALGTERFEHFSRYRRDRLLGELLGLERFCSPDTLRRLFLRFGYRELTRSSQFFSTSCLVAPRSRERFRSSGALSHFLQRRSTSGRRFVLLKSLTDPMNSGLYGRPISRPSHNGELDSNQRRIAMPCEFCSFDELRQRYYANPSWDQQLACTSTSNCPRFVVLSNWIDANFPSGGAAVVDRETGLVW